MNPNEPNSNLLHPSAVFSNAQQTAEDFSDLQSTSKRAGGVGRGKKYAGAEIPHQVIGHDYLIMEQAYAIFESQGERRSVRSIAEYCKNGELVCTYDSDDKRWHITRESVEQKIAKIKAFNARKAAIAPQHTSEPFTEAPAMHQRSPENQRPTEEIPPRSEASPPSPEADKKIAYLEQEIFDLKVLNKSKDLYIAQLVNVNEKLLTRVETTSSLVGRLKEKLFQLVAPEKARDIEVLTAPSETTPEPSVVNGSLNEPLADNPTDHYEHSSQ